MAMRYRILAFALGSTLLGGIGNLSISLICADEQAKKESAPSGFKLVRSLEGHKDTVWSLSFSPDGKLFASAGDTTIRLWDTATGKEIRRKVIDGQLASYAIFVQEGRALACGVGADREVYLLEVPSLVVRSKTELPKEIHHFLAIFRDDKLVMGSSSTDLILWDLAADKKLWSTRFPYMPPPGSPNFPKFVIMAPDKRTIAVALDDATVSLCVVESGKELRRLEDRTIRHANIGDLTFSPNGKLLAVGMGSESLLRLWDIATGESTRAMRWEFHPKLKMVPGGRRVGPGDGPGVWSVAFSPDGKTVAAACDDNKVRLWETATGGFRQEAKVETFRRITFSPDGRVLVTSGGRRKGDIRFWDWRNPGLERPRRLTAAEVERLWVDLSGQDAAAAYRAIAALAASPQQAVRQLGRHLQRVEPIEPTRLDRLLVELDDNDFAIRERAARRLAGFGTATERKLRETLALSPSVEVRRRVNELLRRLETNDNPERLRLLRSVELLEYLDTSEAKEVLEKLASGAAGSAETEDARAALKRLERGQPAHP